MRGRWHRHIPTQEAHAKCGRNLSLTGPSRASAEQAVEGLLGSGMTQQSIIFGSGELPDGGGTRSAEPKLETIPTTDAEPDGMGKAMGAAAALGLGGAAAGAKAGDADRARKELGKAA